LLEASLEDLLARLQSFRDRRDWAQFHTPKDLAISASVEAGELLELFQWRPGDAPLDPDFVAKVASEAADVLIYLVLLADRMEFDLLSAANAKIDENECRFPEAQSFGVAKPSKDT
jgi:NTP pyrophosphatase (non-canonical NTP hydrolase)